MKTFKLIGWIPFFFLLASCGTTSDDIASEADLASFTGTSSSSGSGQDNSAGLITAGEWNDLDNWLFWKDLLIVEDFATMPAYWHFYPSNRIAVEVKNGPQPVRDAKVELVRNGSVIWATKTDNFGKAELWLGLYQQAADVNISEYALQINGMTLGQPVRFYEDGINQIQTSTSSNSDLIELSFIVDATGSMSDELEFLKNDLKDVVQSVVDDNPLLQIRTSSVFYRDEGDDYVKRESPFSMDLNTTLDFINRQSASGGGDTPEAVHTALKSSIESLQWSGEARARIAFLLLDAPPHYTPEILSDLQHSIQVAAQKGIKVIPITASGIDKPTEFLMRFFAIATNGTYVFITNHSGIGNDHIEASVGDYEVEYLNDLMVRLIKKYSE